MFRPTEIGALGIPITGVNIAGNIPSRSCAIGKNNGNVTGSSGKNRPYRLPRPLLQMRTCQTLNAL